MQNPGFMQISKGFTWVLALEMTYRSGLHGGASNKGKHLGEISHKANP